MSGYCRIWGSHGWASAMPLGAAHLLPLLLDSLAHDVERAGAHLVVDAPQVFAEDAEEDQLDAAEEEHQDQRRGLPLNRMVEHAQQRRHDDANQAQTGEQEARRRRELERYVADASLGVE